MRKITCDHPRIILNPLAPELLSQFGNYTLLGVEFGFYKKSVYFSRCPSFLSPVLNCIKHDDLDNCFITDKSTGNTYPLYMEVPCGHCDNCRATKVYNFVHRCKLESMSYDCQPLFLTLTYNEENKPKEGVCLRDVQLFFKRLRINLQRCGFYDRVRYCCVSEYGKSTPHRPGRPHYHAILWNCHATDMVSFKQIKEVINKSWNLGFTYVRLVDLGNDKAFFYTSKYLSKGCNVPEGCNGAFMVSSNRNGGIGAAFIDSLAGHIRRTLDIKPKFLNKWSGKVEELNFNKYVLNRVFPTLSNSLHSSVRTAVKRFVLNFRTLEAFSPQSLDYSFDTTCKKVLETFGALFYIYDPHDNIPSLNYRSPNVLLREMLEDEMIISRSLSKGSKFFSLSSSVASKRERFLGKLFIEQHEPILQTRRIKFLKMEAVTQSRLML